MIKDIWGQEIKNGDFVVSASKSSGTMVMGVMKEVDKQTRVGVKKWEWGPNKGRWEADDKAHRMYTLERTLRLPDEMILDNNPDLFDIMIEVRKKLSLPTNSELKVKYKKNQELLKRLLEIPL